MNAPSPDEQRFLELVKENKPKILKVCRVYAWNPQDQDDLYQEVLFQIWRALPALRDETFIHTWLYRVALNTAISFVRKHSARSRRTVNLEDARLLEIPDRSQQRDAGDEQVAKLYETIAQLNDLEKALTTLYLEELSYEQIAAVMGINANHVGVMLHRIKKKLSALMNEARHE